MADKKPENTEATVLGLPEVGSDPNVPTDPALMAMNTAPSLPPVPAPPPRTKTGSVPRTRTAGAIPARRVEAEPTSDDLAEPPTNPAQRTRIVTKQKDPFEWTLPRVAGLTASVSLAAILLWVFWPAKHAARPRPQEPGPQEAPVVAAPVKPAPPKPVEAVPVPVAPTKPTIALDTRLHVIDPYGAHAEDLPLDPAHKYRLRIERDDGHLGVALARLEQPKGWGVMNKMASHAMLQFGGAKTLRLHCEPGSHFTDGQTLPLELLDLATKKKRAVPVNPATDCWDFAVARRMDLGEGVKHRVRVPTDAKVTLGPNVTLRVAYVLESLGDKTEWRTGVLGPGESVLAEGRAVRFALLDPYAGDNEGTVALELLDGNTENTGLVTPSAAGSQFVPVK